MYDFVEKSMQSELWQVYKTIRSYDPAETTHGRKPMFNECATSAFQRQGSDRYIGHWSLLPRRSGFFDLKHCYQRASADNISRKFGPRSGPTKSLKLIKPEAFPDFFYHTFESTCKNKGADGTTRALRVVPAFY